ncbi:MAG: DAK2 domain-containing protein [Pelosinus sp.]|nr:DAK2 domain-containing protein [Pelosinus sp.]
MTQIEYLTGNDFRRMVAGAYYTFMREHEYINSLNVFPVPDGDTGTNMLLTLGAVAKAMDESPESGIGSMAKWAADSAIMGARGNSGVILSQIFRGIARGLASKEQASSSELGKAFQYGILYAYRAVAKPVEGTILTVAKGIAKGARDAVREGRLFAEILEQAVAAGEIELQRTPELLPALKAAGVVDAGGRGLIVFLQGCLEGLGGEYCAPEANFSRDLRFKTEEIVIEQVHPYCTEFIVRPCHISLPEARHVLEPMGESLVVAEGTDLLKVHIHTGHPGLVLESAVTWGTLHDIKIDNMADQHRETIGQNTRDKRPAVPVGKQVVTISVGAGAGIEEIMRSLGADVIVSGGQTMNPSVEDLVGVVHSGSADKYIIMPNNKNIILAALQARKLLPDKVEVVETANIPQGLAALMAYDEKLSAAENVTRMTARAKAVKAGAITIAVRDSMLAGQLVPTGAYIGVINSHVAVYAGDLFTTLAGMVKQLITPESEIVSLYYGCDLTENEAGAIADKLRAELDEVEVELYAGGQPLYHFLISVE